MNNKKLTRNHPYEKWEKMSNRTITFEERKIIQKLFDDGLSSYKIATFLNRGKNSINVEIRRSGGRASYNAENAQKLSEKRHAERYTERKAFYLQEQFEKFSKLVKEGVNSHEIRKTIKCGYISLLSMYKKLGIKVPSVFGLMQELSDKIYNIEQQLEILFEITKK